MRQPYPQNKAKQPPVILSGTKDGNERYSIIAGLVMLLVCAAILLSGCGQTGRLYLPEQPTQDTPS